MNKQQAMSGLKKELPSHRNELEIPKAPSVLDNYTFTNPFIQYSILYGQKHWKSEQKCSLSSDFMKFIETY